MLSNMPLPRTLSYQQNLPLRGDGYMNPELFPDNQLGIYSEFPATPSPPNSGSKASWLVFFPIIQVPIAIIQSSLNPATSEGNGCHGAATWNSWACCILPACRLVCCFTQCIWWLMQVFFIDQIPNYIKKSNGGSCGLGCVWSSLPNLMMWGRHGYKKKQVPWMNACKNPLTLF